VRRGVSILWGLILCAGFGGCASQRPGEEWIAEAAARSAKVEAALQAGRIDEARESLRSLSRARVVAQDACYRLAELEIASGRVEQALAEADTCLRRDRTRDLFTANLLYVRGRAYETLRQDARAAQDYQQALQINEELLEKALAPLERP
jgi:tetratricopeptide (TPR) repeat protein